MEYGNSADEVLWILLNVGDNEPRNGFTALHSSFCVVGGRRREEKNGTRAVVTKRKALTW